MKTILIGIISKVVASTLIFMAKGGKKIIFDKELVKKLEIKDKGIQNIIEESLNTTVDEIKWEEPPSIELATIFISSPEVENVIRQILSTKLISEDEKYLPLIKKEFLDSFNIYCELNDITANNSGNALWDSLLTFINKGLDVSIDLGKLSAHEAKSTFRFKRIMDELSNVNKTLELFPNLKQSSVKEFLEFESKYRKQIAGRHWYIMPPYFDTARKVKIDDLYVRPNFFSFISKKD